MIPAIEVRSRLRPVFGSNKRPYAALNVVRSNLDRLGTLGATRNEVR